MKALTRKPDPELLPILRPRCPKCQMRMISTSVAAAAKGFENRTFECLKCGHTESRTVVADPVVAHVADGWINGRTWSVTRALLDSCQNRERRVVPTAKRSPRQDR